MVSSLFTYFSLPNLSTIAQAHISLIHPFAAVAMIFTAVYYYLRCKSTIYLVDFTCYLPGDNLRTPRSLFKEHVERANVHNRESIEFQNKLSERSGISDEAYAPSAMQELPADTSLYPSIAETKEVLFTVVNDLLSKHNINPKSIDILVSNCSLFCPTPSITTMIINKFGFRSNIKSISLSGMGCSAGILSISLAKDLLKVHKNSLALVLSMETVTPNGYKGSTKSMLIGNVIFRMGGAATLLSNRHQDKQKAKYKLQHLVRTHMGSDDQSYLSVFQQPDADGEVGVSLSRDLLHAAAKALRINISHLSPLVLPYSEQLRYGWTVIRQKVWAIAGPKDVYVPNFRKAFEHFCIHAGGKAVIQAMEDNLRLQKEDGEASRMTFYRFGNTSSSSIWYELCYLEAKGKVRKGDRIWQIAFGSGFKVNSAVWKCISNLEPKVKNAWSDRIHLYPVDIPNVP